MNRLVYRIATLLRRLGVNFHEEKDARVKAMRDEIRRIGGVEFNIELFKDGTWAAESTNLDGIITGGSDRQRIHDVLRDAVFTYFEIPPQFCNDALMRGSDEPVKLARRVYA